MSSITTRKVAGLWPAPTTQEAARRERRQCRETGRVVCERWSGVAERVRGAVRSVHASEASGGAFVEPAAPQEPLAGRIGVRASSRLTKRPI
jgi:hypothetical protein